MLRRNHCDSAYEPAPAITSAAAAPASSSATRSPSSRNMAVSVRPTDTSATTSPPSSRTGTTARTDGPSVPTYVSVKSSTPAAAGPIVPRYIWPISVGSGWVNRMPCGVMTTMKSVPVCARTFSASGWSTADGSGSDRESRTSGIAARVWAMPSIS